MSLMRLAIVAVLIAPTAAQGRRPGQCHALNVYLPDLLAAGQSMAIAPVQVRIERAADLDIERIRRALVEALAERLNKRKFISVVDKATGPDLQKEADLVFAAEIAPQRGRGVGRIFQGGNRDEEARLEMHAELRESTDAGRTIMDFHCFESSKDDWFSAGGLLGLIAKSGQQHLTESAHHFGRELAKDFEKMEKEIDKTARKDAKKKSRIKGKTKPVDSSAVELESLKDLVRLVDSSGVHSEREDGLEVDALWLTADAHRLIGQFPEYAALEKKSPKADVLERAFLTDLAPVKPWLGQDVYLFVMNLINHPLKRGPFMWDNARPQQTTELVNLSEGGKTITPSEVSLDAIPSSLLVRMKGMKIKGLSSARPMPHRLRPIVFVFPTTGSDGKPFVGGLNQVLELRTRVGGHPIELTFDLGHFRVSDLGSLSLANL